MSPAVLVAGATGALGGAACRRLVAGGAEVVGLVRPTAPPEARAALEALGVRLAVGDLEQPETLPAALAGIEVVVSTASAFPGDPRPDAIARVDRDGQLALVDAAVAAGVRRLVYVSFPPTEPDFPFQRAKRAVEERLAGAGLETVVLQPGKFMDVWFSPPLGLDREARTVRIYGDGEQPQSWVAVADVAAVAAHAALDDALVGETVVFGGPAAVTQLEVVALLERLEGVAYERVGVPVAELEAMRDAPGATLASLGAILLQATHPDVLPPVGDIAGAPVPGVSVEAHLSLS